MTLLLKVVNCKSMTESLMAANDIHCTPLPQGGTTSTVYTQIKVGWKFILDPTTNWLCSHSCLFLLITTSSIGAQTILILHYLRVLTIDYYNSHKCYTRGTSLSHKWLSPNCPWFLNVISRHWQTSTMVLCDHFVIMLCWATPISVVYTDNNAAAYKWLFSCLLLTAS